MIVAVADTHAAIWYLDADPRMSAAARLFMNTTANSGDEIAVSGVTLVEMVYLVEKARIPPHHFSNLARELGDPDSIFVEVPVDLKIARAMSRVDVGQIPDMPDRIIAATALSLNVPLISRDHKIQVSGINTLW